MKVNKDGTVTISRNELLATTGEIIKSEVIKVNDEGINLIATFASALEAALFDLTEDTKIVIEPFTKELDALTEAFGNIPDLPS